ncbi:DUF489 family protein [Devosia albogilva]|uniref:DUF489 family protein n=1 Tax=Devosia albogilva TaxID=429726 RepID=A0ABW5QQH2_9HYPH
MSTAKLPMSYAMALLQLEKKVYSNPEYVKIIETAQQKILKQLSFFDNNYLHPSIIANLAQTYVETAGQINPRILVRGNAEAFKISIIPPYSCMPLYRLTTCTFMEAARWQLMEYDL